MTLRGGGKLQKGDLMLDTRNISLYELFGGRPITTIMPFIFGFVIRTGRGFMNGPGSEKYGPFEKSVLKGTPKEGVSI